MKISQNFISYNLDNQELLCINSWDMLSSISDSILLVLSEIPKHTNKVTVNANNITHLDSVGALLLYKIINELTLVNISCDLQLNDKLQQRYDEFLKYKAMLQPAKPKEKEDFLNNLGAWVILLCLDAKNLFLFYSEVASGVFLTVRRYKIFNWSEYVDTVVKAGLGGIFISSLLCFLIGVTLTYQIAPQFMTYGANLYIVNFLGIALLREITPLLTAIIIAGRSGSAITAEIGTMKVQEELDALKTMGISPIVKLYIPKIIALITVLPILTILADIASIGGGLVVSGPLLGVDAHFFMSRMQDVVSVNNLLVGIFKSFIFGMMIGLVGCYCGTQASSSGDGVGIQTTKSVVMSILSIIVVDAAFAMIFQQLGV